MSTAELIAEGRAKLAFSQLHPLIASDPRTVVSAQISITPAGIANADLIVWALNHLGELLDLVEETQRPTGEPRPFPADLTGAHRDAMRDVVAIVEAARRGDKASIEAIVPHIWVSEVLGAFAHLVIKLADEAQLDGLRRLVDATTAEEADRA